ncbi:UNVERIFIED_CONTAM: Meiotic nuclear division protein 1 [Sesamum indicum]
MTPRASSVHYTFETPLISSYLYSDSIVLISRCFRLDLAAGKFDVFERKNLRILGYFCKSMYRMRIGDFGTDMEFLIRNWNGLVKSKKRGLSLDEKREKMLQIFYESQDFFLLKELEKLGPKKGVITQSVKDVVQSLVDDDLVFKDKIGTSVYFWSLPSCAGNQLRNIHRKLDSDLQSSKKRYIELTDQCNALKKGREESVNHLPHSNFFGMNAEVIAPFSQDEIVEYSDNDPATFEAMKKAIEVAHAAANRWTDNIFTLQQWCSHNFPQAKEQLDHLYNEVGIADDFDYLELPAAASVCSPGDQMLEGKP